jgi:hypothetical protein
LHGETSFPYSGVRTWIINRHLIFQGVVIHASQAFDEMQPIGMRQRIAIHPGALIKTDRIDDERVSLPMANGMPVIAGREIAS